MKLRTYKIINSIIIGTLLFMVLTVMYVGYLVLIDANPPITIEIPLKVDKAVYKPGEDMAITANICRNTDVPAQLYVSFTETDKGLTYLMQEETVSSAPLGCNTFTRVVHAPDIPSGKYIRVTRAEYRVNFFANRIVEFHTEDFYISNPHGVIHK